MRAGSVCAGKRRIGRDDQVVALLARRGPGRMRLSSVASARMRSHSLTRRLAMPMKRTGVSLNAASTASVGTASCICEPSITAGMCGNMRDQLGRLRIGLREGLHRHAEVDRPPVSASAAQR